MKRLSKTIIISLFTLALNLAAQNFTVDKIEPPNWWAGMKWDTLQLMIYGENLTGIEIGFNQTGLDIIKFTATENQKYLFVDVALSAGLKPGNYELNLTSDHHTEVFQYEFKQRELDPRNHNGFSNEDVVYLIFVDRFNNGDISNDTLENSRDEFKDRSLNGRHGGDLQGVIDKLDYLSDLGITAIWLTPTLENDMYMSYHGYAATDLYKIDKRFGSNELYKELVNKAHEKGIKVIYDHVSNHIGINHPWVSNLPFESWINGTVGHHENANHNKTSIVDIYSNDSAREINSEGWFTDYMIDLNQRNEFVANYLIQNTIWWIEYSGIDGIREDTYPYSDQKFMSNWAKVILEEYPNFNIVGEIWTGEPAFLAGFQANSKVRDSNTHLPSIIDFGMRDSFARYLKDERGLYDIYNTLAKDLLYSNPQNLMPFIDNHDVDRGMYLADGDYEKFKIALTILLTTRGIPQIFYGTEIGINEGDGHGKIRKPFPGGFFGDKRNAFSEEERTEIENNIFDHLKKLIELRKVYKPLATGKLTHFYPVDETYIYFKEYDNQKLMIIINDNETEFEVDLSRMKSEFEGVTNLTDIFTNEMIDYSTEKNIILQPKTSKIYLLN